MKMNKKTAGLVVAAVILLGALLWQPKGGLYKAIWQSKDSRLREKEAEITRYTATFLDVFDTRTEIVGYGTSEEEFRVIADQVKEKLRYYHELYDIYNSYDGINNIKTINDNAGIAPVVVDREIIELLKISRDMYDHSEGQVNIAMGSVLSIWHDYRDMGRRDPENAKLPKMNDLKNANLHTDIGRMMIDEEASTVFLENPDMSLDVGGIGKGYAVQKTAEYVKKELGVEHMLISVGGNVCAIGGKLDGEKWTIGIQNPDLLSEKGHVGKVEVADSCVVTSGDYQRYYEVDGKRYCHIIDPDTLMPADYFASVTIICRDSAVADAMSTAVYNMTLEEGMEFVNAQDGVEAMWILKDGTIHCSKRFGDYLK